MNTTEFLEKYLSNYHNRDDVARYLDLDKMFRGETDESFSKDLYMSANCYIELAELQDKLMSEALQSLIKQNEVLLEACKTSLEDTQMLLDGECDFSNDNLQATIDHLQEAIDFKNHTQ